MIYYKITDWTDFPACLLPKEIVTQLSNVGVDSFDIVKSCLGVPEYNLDKIITVFSVVAEESTFNFDGELHLPVIVLPSKIERGRVWPLPVKLGNRVQTVYSADPSNSTNGGAYDFFQNPIYMGHKAVGVVYSTSADADYCQCSSTFTDCVSIEVEGLGNLWIDIRIAEDYDILPFNRFLDQN